MRITNRMMTNSYLKDMRSNLSNMQTIHQQLTSGKEVRRPSDDPIKVSRSMEINKDIQINAQYENNIKDILNNLDAADTALNQLNNSMQRIRELVVSAGNAAYGTDERKAIQDEVNSKVEEIAQILNTNFDGKYIFGGSKGDSKPVGVKTDAVTGNKTLILLGSKGEELELNSADSYINNQIEMIGEKLKVEVSQGVEIEYNSSAIDVLLFTNADGEEKNVIDILSRTVENLTTEGSDAQEELLNKNLEEISEVLGNISKVRSEIGARQNRMESAREKNEMETLNLKEILSETEDIDFTEKMMEYSVVQTVYMASLQTAAKIIQPSLLDYIR